jgi:hypothetical protein
MKVIKDLNVQVTYRAGLGDVEVSEKVFNGLLKIENEPFNRMSDDDMNRSKDKEMIAAFEWLSYFIKERDAHSWEYEVEVIE